MKNLSSSLMSRSKRFALSLMSLSLSLIDGGKEVGQICAKPSKKFWSILVNGSWRFLGTELSVLLDVALHCKEQYLIIENIINADLKTMSVTFPIYAQLKRVSVPSISAILVTNPEEISLKMAALEMNFNILSKEVMTIKSPYLQMTKDPQKAWNDWNTVFVETKSISFHSENIM